MQQPIEMQAELVQHGVAGPFILPLMRYYFEGTAPDLWLQAVLSSDVIAAAEGSPIQMQNLKPIVNCLRAFARQEAWGSGMRFRSWRDCGGLHGLAVGIMGHTSWPQDKELKAPLATGPGRIAPTPDRQWMVHHVVLKRTRPESWPYPGPIWVVPGDVNMAGRLASEILVEYPECVLVRAVLPEDVPVRRVWPAYREIVYSSHFPQDDRELIFTEVFACPPWWDPETKQAVGAEPERL